MAPEKDLMADLLDKKFKNVLKLLRKLEENLEKVKKKTMYDKIEILLETEKNVYFFFRKRERENK